MMEDPVPVIDRYWKDDRSVPFGTLLSYLEKYYSPEVHYDNYEFLVARARSADPSDTGLMTFKEEIARVLRGDREGLHPQAIFTAAEYDQWGNDEEFLAWLWTELFPDEPLPGGASRGEVGPCR